MSLIGKIFEATLVQTTAFFTSKAVAKGIDRLAEEYKRRQNKVDDDRSEKAIDVMRKIKNDL